MAKQRQDGGLGRALLASLVLHALLLLWLGLSLRHPAPSRARPAPIEVTLWEPRPAPPAIPEARPQAPAARPAEPAAAPAAPQAAAAPRRPERAPSAEPAAEPSSSVASAAAVPGAGAGGSAPGEGGDSPRGTLLLPRVGTLFPGLGQGGSAPTVGHTLTNGPGEAPDPEAVAAYTAETMKRKLDQDLAQGAANAQRRSGLLAPYFNRLQSSVDGALQGAGVKLRQRSAGEAFREEVVGTWQPLAEAYGKTGSPVTSPQADRTLNTGLGRSVERGDPALGDVGFARESAKTMQQFAAMEAFVDQALRARLRTVLELRQDATGAVAEAVVLERSGDNEFDEFVLHEARKAVRDQGEVQDGGAPYEEGWRTIWQFTWEPPRVRARLLRVLRGMPANPFERLRP